MNQKIIILDADKKQSEELCIFFQSHFYDSIGLNSLPNLETWLNQHDCMAVLIDIDTIPVDNRMIRDLTLKYPKIIFFGMSKYKVHPELKDTICYHVYACMTRPLDTDEILYWLKCIEKEQKENQ
jgi:DNA-binding NtrC family response regulator